MKEIGIIGVDLAKNLVLQHGVAADWAVLFRKRTVAIAVPAIRGGRK